MDKLITYVKSSIVELHKVTWPTKKQTINYSLVVLGLAIGIAIFFSIADNVLNRVLTAIIK